VIASRGVGRATLEHERAAAAKRLSMLLAGIDRAEPNDQHALERLRSSFDELLGRIESCDVRLEGLRAAEAAATSPIGAVIVAAAQPQSAVGISDGERVSRETSPREQLAASRRTLRTLVTAAASLSPGCDQAGRNFRRGIALELARIAELRNAPLPKHLERRSLKRKG